MVMVVGILAEATGTSTGSITTVYTVPSGKYARIRILFMHEGGGGTTSGNLFIFSPNTEQTIHDYGGAGTDHISGAFARRVADASTTTSDPPYNTACDIGYSSATNQIDLDGVSFAGTLGGYFATPFQSDYFGSAGDTIRYQWQNQAPYDALIQVIGYEGDL